MENVEISTTHLDGVPFTPNLSYAQNFTQIADFYHNFITVDTIGLTTFSVRRSLFEDEILNSNCPRL